MGVHHLHYDIGETQRIREYRVQYRVEYNTGPYLICSDGESDGDGEGDGEYQNIKTVTDQTQPGWNFV